MPGFGTSRWMLWIAQGGDILDSVPPGRMTGGVSGFLYPDVIPQTLIEDILREEPVREISQPYRFRRKTRDIGKP